MTTRTLTGWIKDAGRAFYGRIDWDERGIITGVEELPCGDSAPPEQTPIITAGLFNAHSHPEQSIYTDMVDKSWDLGTWCRQTIYKYSTSMTPRRVRLACRRAFARMLRFGTTSVMVSYYLHCGQDNECDREVIAAARDVGIRLIFGRMNYDIITENAYEAKKESQRSYYESISQAERNVRALSELENTTLMVCPALHSMHASTAEAIAAGIRLGFEMKRPVQFHLSEDQGDVSLSIQEHGCRPMVFLQRILDQGEIPSLSHLILSDCCWLDDEELDIIAAHGMKVVLNPRMNARVKTGFPDVAAMTAHGIPLWCGTDGEASNDSLNVEDEKTFLKERCASSVAPTTIDAIGTLPFAFGAGHVGRLQKGAWADIRIMRGECAETAYVGGIPVLENGQLCRLDEERDIETPLKEEIALMTAGMPS
ncbi:MAG: amidohydrolase family protein [Pyramidobacter sp.]|nr:amidohydrolase family protein [Pyramidobacter sp.]